MRPVTTPANSCCASSAAPSASRVATCNSFSEGADMVFPATPLPVKVEISHAGTWVDITPYVYLEDIQITRGSSDETAVSQPTRCTMRIHNREIGRAHV